MAAYWIARVKVEDPTAYARYTSATPTIIKRFGGRFMVRGGAQEILEGSDEWPRTAVVEFPDLVLALACYHSADYQAAKVFRDPAAQVQVWIVEGV